MSSEDLTVDSVPDAPRENVSVENTESKPEKSKSQNENGKKSNKQKKTKKEKPEPSSSIPSCSNSGKASASPNVICISNASNVHIGNSVSIQYITNEMQRVSPSARTKKCQKSAEIKETFKNTEPVTEKDMDIVAEHVGRNWRKLGNELGFSEGQMDQNYTVNVELGMKEVIYIMLLQWKQDKCEDATVGILCKSLWTSEEYAAAHKLANYSRI